MFVKKPTTRRDISRQRTGASMFLYAFIAIVVIVILAMFFWQPWKPSPPAAPLRITTTDPHAQATTTTVPTP